jgi:hypothetical protein
LLHGLENGREHVVQWLTPFYDLVDPDDSGMTGIAGDELPRLFGVGVDGVGELGLFDVGPITCR